MMDRDSVEWARASEPRYTPRHNIREKRYKLDPGSQAWSLLDVLKALATFAIGSWIAWRVLDLLAGGGAR